MPFSLLFLTILSYNSSNTIYWSVICYWCMYSCRRASCMNHTIISNINSNMPDSFDRIITDQISRLLIRPWNYCSIASLGNGTVWKIVSKMLKNLHCEPRAVNACQQVLTTPFVRSSLKLKCVINYLLTFGKCRSAGTSIVCNCTACCSCWFLRG